MINIQRPYSLFRRLVFTSLISLNLCGLLQAQPVWDGPVLINSLELPSEASELPILELSRIILSLEDGGTPLAVVVESDGNEVVFKRLSNTNGGANLLSDWQNAFTQESSPIREGTEFGPVAVDLVSRLESEKRIPEMEGYRQQLAVLLQNPEVSQLRVVNLPPPQAILRSALEKEIPILKRHEITRIKVPEWILTFSFVSVETQTSRSETIYSEIEPHDLVAVVGIVDRNNHANSIFGVIEPFGHGSRMKTFTNRELTEELSNLLHNEYFTRNPSLGLLKFFKKEFRIDKIKEKLHKEGKFFPTYQLVTYSLPDPQTATFVGIKDLFVRAWLEGHSLEAELLVNPTQLLESMAIRRSKVIPDLFKDDCPSRLSTLASTTSDESRN